MIKITIFAGHEGQWAARSQFYLTLFAGVELWRPTVARQIIMAREAERAGPSQNAGNHTTFFLTLCGGVEIKWPTMAAEYLELRNALSSGVLRMEDWDVRAMTLSDKKPSSSSTLTLLSGFDEDKLPEEKEEIDALAIQRHIGAISEEGSQILQLGIGQKQAERLSIVRRAIDRG